MATNTRVGVDLCITKVFVALYDYSGRSDEDLSFKKGDHLIIFNDKQRDWWFAESKTTNRLGYIPREFVAELGSSRHEPWYFANATRNQAEKWLMLPENGHGSFLVRYHESKKDPYYCYYLSVRDGQTVKHHKIQKLDSDGYIIEEHKLFHSLPHLVCYYHKCSDALGVKLRNPCIKQAGLGMEAEDDDDDASSVEDEDAKS